MTVTVGLSLEGVPVGRCLSRTTTAHSPGTSADTRPSAKRVVLRWPNASSPGGRTRITQRYGSPRWKRARPRGCAGEGRADHRRRSRVGATSTRPSITSWMVQMYVNVPASANRCGVLPGTQEAPVEVAGERTVCIAQAAGPGHILPADRPPGRGKRHQGRRIGESAHLDHGRRSGRGGRGRVASRSGSAATSGACRNGRRIRPSMLPGIRGRIGWPVVPPYLGRPATIR